MGDSGSGPRLAGGEAQRSAGAGDDRPILGESVALLLADCQRALEEEIEAVQADLGRRGLALPVPAVGRLGRENPGGFSYAFQLPRGRLDIRGGDRVRIRLRGGREPLAVVREFDRASALVQVTSFEWMGERVEGAELEFDPTWLLRELSLRLDAIVEEPGSFHPEMIESLLGLRPPRTGRASAASEAGRDLNESQREALERILGSEVQLVWDPPGTGKTRLVAHAALELAREGRVLVVAATNGAVDEVAARIRERVDADVIGANRIVRVGSEVGGGGDPALTLEAAVARRVEGGAAGIARTIAELEGKLGAPPESGRPRRGRGEPGLRPRIARLLAIARSRDDSASARTLGRLSLELTRQAIQVLEESDIVLTTLARLSVREELRGLRFRSVVLDEASNAGIPYTTLAAAHASHRAVAVGDFQQLPPVVASRGPAGRRWLRQDIFREAGVAGRGPEGGPALPSPRDSLCAMLTLQYRMGAPIRRLVSEMFYGGRLEDAPEVSAREGPGHPLVLLDTSSVDPVVERVEGSRRNLAHADVVVQLLELAALGGITDVAVVSPYRQQTRRIRELVRARLGGSAPGGLEVSTIHRFQGREKTLVVIDTVDAPPGRSWFLDERRNPDLPRLLNVALSRARERLVVVGCVEGLQRTLAPESLLNRIVRRVAETGECLAPGDLVGGDVFE